ncbi:MAG: winged helix-turn-helix domain-containing protein, partial [Myxococcota bacterium]
MRVFRLGRRTVDLDRAIVVYDAEAIGLTSLETRLLDHLARRAGEIVPRDELLTEVWGYRPGVQTRTIDATTGRLRAKLEDDPTAPRHLFTVYGQGLRLDGVEGPPSGFFGRADELAHALERLRTARRVAFVGPAGVGKSRVAVELVARARLASAEVACRSLRSGSDVDQAVARRLDLAGPVGPALARLGALVVVLDECDDCVDAVAERVPHWLAEAPRLCVVATSRVRIPGEPPVSLEPLPEDDALALFLARAGAPDTERTTVRRVVQALEGLPLALELAAARFSLIGPDRLVELLGAPLEVLSGRGRTSMAEVLERSFERLDPVDRRALAAASTFEGPFDLDALAAVVGAARGPALDALDALVSQSLVRVVQPGVYRLFAVVRDRARRDLTGADPLWDAHATWFGRLGEPERLLSMDPADRRAARAAEADLAA